MFSYTVTKNFKLLSRDSIYIGFIYGSMTLNAWDLGSYKLNLKTVNDKVLQFIAECNQVKEEKSMINASLDKIYFEDKPDE